MGSGSSARSVSAEATSEDVSIFLQQLSDDHKRSLLKMPEDVVVQGYKAWANAENSPTTVHQSTGGRSDHSPDQERTSLMAQDELVAKIKELAQLVVEPTFDYDSDVTRAATGQDSHVSKAHMQDQVARLKGHLQDAKETAEKLCQHIAKLEMSWQRVMDSKKKAELDVLRCLAFNDKLMGSAGRVSMAGTQFRNAGPYDRDRPSNRNCEVLCDTAMWTGRHMVEFCLLPSGKFDTCDSFGMSAADAGHDNHPGAEPKSCGLMVNGFWCCGGKHVDPRAVDEGWCKPNDLVQLCFDASTHTLEIYCNGTRISWTDKVEVGWHFSVGRCHGEVHVKIVQPVRILTCEFTLSEDPSVQVFVKCFGLDGDTLACIPCTEESVDVAWLRAKIVEQLGSNVRLVHGKDADSRVLEDSDLLNTFFPSAALDKRVAAEEKLTE